MSDGLIPKHVAYVFDAASADVQTLIEAAIASGTASRITAKIFRLQAGSDGVQHLASALEVETDLDAIHIFWHGSVGSLQLSSTFLNASTLNRPGADFWRSVQIRGDSAFACQPGNAPRSGQIRFLPSTKS